MTRGVFGATVLFIGSILPAQGVPTHEKHGGLVLKELQVPKKARVVGYEIHLKRGTFESVSGIPVGWRLVVDNDPTGKSACVLLANPSAHALTEEGLQNILIQIAEQEGDDGPSDVWGWITLESDPTWQHRLPLSSYSFRFVEQYVRHRLR